jgi:hypothetical protein
MKRIFYTTGLMTLLLFVFATTFSNAQPRVDFRLQIGQEKHPVRYFDDRYIPNDAMREMRYAGIADDDMPIIFYIKSHSQYSLRQIYSLRARGATWSQLSNWCGVSLNGPPYGNAYGHYKKHRDYSDARHYDKHSRHDE